MNNLLNKAGMGFRILVQIVLVFSVVITVDPIAASEQPESEKQLAPDQLTQPLPVDPELHQGKLANGLTYYIRRNAKPKQHVELRLIVKAGSILEDDDQLGLAHFAEHLAFDGTRHFPQHTLTSTLESLGVKFGADLNAFTNFDDTIYILQLPLDKPENLETGIQILEDWAQGAQMTDQSIALERPIVLEEARMTKGAQDRMNKQLIPEIYNGSRYAERVVIGSESILARFKPTAVRRFYHDWYRPDLEAIVIVGDIDSEQVLKKIEQHFSGLTNPADERVRNYTKINDRSKSAGLVVTDPEAVVDTLTIRYPVQPAQAELDVADYRRILIRRLFFDMINFRLTEKTQQADPPFISASYAVESTAVGAERIDATAVIGRERIAPALAMLASVNRQLRRDGFTAQELDRSKKDLQHQFDMLYAERIGTHSATFADMYRRNFLLQQSTIGVDDQYKLVLEIMPGITLEDVSGLVNQMLPTTEPLLVTYTGARGQEGVLPDGPGLLHLLELAERDDNQVGPQPDVSRPVPLQLMTRPAAVGTILSKRSHEGLGLTEFTLSNGVKVLFKPTGLQKEQVLISAQRFGGQSLFSDADKFNAQYASQLQAAMGVGDYAPIEMARILAGKSVHLQTELGLYDEKIIGSANTEDLETLLQWLYLAMTAPRTDPALFNSYLGRLQDVAGNSMSNPDTVFVDKVSAAVFNSHPRAPYPPHASDFDHISLDRISDVYRQRFGNADGLTFIIAGSIDIDKIAPLVLAYLGTLPTTKAEWHYRDIGLTSVTGKKRLDVKVGKDDKSQVIIMFNGPTNYSLKEINTFDTAVEIVNQRILHVLREKLSLIYSGSISGDIERIPTNFYNITATLPCAKGDTERVIVAMHAEIERLKSEGPRPDELERVKQIWRESRKTSMQSNQFWMQQLQRDVLYHTNPDAILTYDERITAVTAAQVQEAARRYFNPDNELTAVLHPADTLPKASTTSAHQSN